MAGEQDSTGGGIAAKVPRGGAAILARVPVVVELRNLLAVRATKPRPAPDPSRCRAA